MPIEQTKKKKKKITISSARAHAYAQKYEFRHGNMAYENVQFRPSGRSRSSWRCTILTVQEKGIVFGMTIYRYLSYSGIVARYLGI